MSRAISRGAVVLAGVAAPVAAVHALDVDHDSLPARPGRCAPGASPFAQGTTGLAWHPTLAAGMAFAALHDLAPGGACSLPVRAPAPAARLGAQPIAHLGADRAPLAPRRPDLTTDRLQRYVRTALAMAVNVGAAYTATLALRGR